MAAESSKGKEHVSWGQEARLDQMRQHYTVSAIPYLTYWLLP